MVRFLRLALLSGAGLYTAGYLLWRLLLITPLYEHYWQLQLSEVVGSWFYLPLLPLLPLTLLARDRRTAVVLLIPALFFLAEYGRQFLPNWQALWPGQEEAIPLRVMTWNTLFTTGRDGEFQTLVAHLQPDVIALQEVSYGFGLRLPQALAKRYPYQQIYAAGTAASLAVLSRFPMHTEETERPSRFCRCQQVKIDLAGQSITLVNTHFWRPALGVDYFGDSPIAYFDSQHQTPLFTLLTEQINTITGPLIVVGDLNTTERQPNFKRLRRSLQDAFAAAGWGMGYTYPAHEQWASWPALPLIRIDHILLSQEWQARAAWTGRLSTSDHRYVMADLELR